MRSYVSAVCAAAIVMAASATVASAGTNSFLRVDGIDGESTAVRHKGEIDVTSFSFRVGNTGQMAYGGGGGTGKVEVQDLHVVKLLDKASAGLYRAAAMGTHIKQVRLVSEKAPEQLTFLTVILEDALVSSISVLGNGGGSAAGISEEVAFSFGKITWTYGTQRPDGTLAPAITNVFDAKSGVLSVGAAAGSGASLPPGSILQQGVVLQPGGSALPAIQRVKVKPTTPLGGAVQKVLVPGM